MGNGRFKPLSMRDLGEFTLFRARFLIPEDRLMIEQMVRRGLTCEAYARISGRTPRSIQKRFKRLIQHLQDPRVVYILSHHRHWPAPLAEAALEVYVRDRTLRSAAQILRLSLHQLRKHLQSVRGILEQALNPRRIHRTADQLLTEVA